MDFIRIFRNTLLFGFILSIAFAIIMSVLVIDREPAVQEVQTVGSEDAVRTRLFVQKVIEDLLEKSDQPFFISATEKELNGLFAFAIDPYPKFAAEPLFPLDDS